MRQPNKIHSIVESHYSLSFSTCYELCKPITIRTYRSLQLLGRKVSQRESASRLNSYYLPSTITPSSIEIKHFGDRTPFLGIVLSGTSPVYRSLVDKRKLTAGTLSISSDCSDAIFTNLKTKYKIKAVT